MFVNKNSRYDVRFFLELQLVYEKYTEYLNLSLNGSLDSLARPSQLNLIFNLYSLGYAIFR